MKYQESILKLLGTTVWIFIWILFTLGAVKNPEEQTILTLLFYWAIFVALGWKFNVFYFYEAWFGKFSKSSGL